MSGHIVFKTDLDEYAADPTPIGQGGSGRVYLANGSDGQTYAIKVLDQGHASRTKLKRFMNELNFGRRVRHDNIVPVVDSGIVSVKGAETPFFVMPQYKASLRALIAGGLKPDRALMLFDGVLSGLEFAHARSVWHRDVKPENILHDEATDRLLLADFGIAHFEEDDLHTAVETRDGERLANFAYAAPEQRQKGSTVDHRADIYAVGLILNEMITGRVPHGTSYRRVADVSARHAYVDTVVDRAIRSDAAERHESMEALRRDLRCCPQGQVCPWRGRLRARLRQDERKNASSDRRKASK